MLLAGWSSPREAPEVKGPGACGGGTAGHFSPAARRRAIQQPRAASLRLPKFLEANETRRLVQEGTAGHLHRRVTYDITIQQYTSFY